jgi:cyanamide hydratase
MSLSKDGAYGWQAVPRDSAIFVASASESNTRPYGASTVPIPSDSVSHATLEYARSHLNPKTFNHSLRIYLYGHIIAHQHFTNLLSLPHFLETYFAACMLHDIGTTDDNIVSSKMSFEFKGAMIAMDFLREAGAKKDLVEQVGETIIRHQDVGETGTQTAVGGLIHVTTLLGMSSTCF